jgi:hypothetical protein
MVGIVLIDFPDGTGPAFPARGRGSGGGDGAYGLSQADLSKRVFMKPRIGFVFMPQVTEYPRRGGTEIAQDIPNDLNGRPGRGMG